MTQYRFGDDGCVPESAIIFYQEQLYEARRYLAQILLLTTGLICIRRLFLVVGL